MKMVRWLGFATLTISASSSAQVILNASSWAPPQHVLTAGMLVPLCAEIEKATSARVKCNILPKAVVAPQQTFDAIRDGLADLSYVTHGYTPGRFPLAEIVEFPFMGDTAQVTSVAFQRIYQRMLAKADEHKGVTVLSVFTHGPGEIYNTRRPIAALKDLDGMKIRVGSPTVVDIVQALGAVPMLKPANESYELLSSGVADGMVLPKESPVGFKLVPLIKYATIVPGGLYTQGFAWVVNTAKWNSIPEADRKLLQPVIGEALAARSGKAWDEADTRGVAALQEAKIPTITANAAFVAQIKSKTDQLEKEWTEKKAKPKGIDGAAALKALRAEIAVLSKK
jgi:TRAP-type C4-dicarboxylate transport system substrate-binding protein